MEGVTINRRRLLESMTGAVVATLAPAMSMAQQNDGAGVGTFSNTIDPGLQRRVEVTGAIAPKVHVVATTAQLSAALNAAVDDETIVLSSGDYGHHTISGRNFGSYVTLRSEQPKGAVFQSLSVLNSSRLRIDGVRVSSPNNGSQGSKVTNIENSHHIDFLNCETHGLVDDNYSGHYGLFILNCQDIVIRKNYVHDVHNGIALFSTSRLTVVENHVDYIGTDGFKFAGLTDFLIENNISGGRYFPAPGDHSDFIQGQGSSTNGVLRGNVHLPVTAGAATCQGVFVADGLYDNIVIEQNIVCTGMANGIVIDGGPTTNNIVRNNTLINAPGLVHDGTFIIIVGAGTNSKNIVCGATGSITANGITAQHTKPGRAAYYDKLFANARRGLGITLQDLRPIAGSAADFGSGMGAEQRLYQLLNP